MFTATDLRRLAKKSLVVVGTIAPSDHGPGRVIRLKIYSAGSPVDPEVVAPLGRVTFELSYAEVEQSAPVFKFELDVTDDEIREDIDRLHGAFRSQFLTAKPFMVILFGSEAQSTLRGDEDGVMKIVAMIEWALRNMPTTDPDPYCVRATLVRRLWSWQHDDQVETFMRARSIL